MSTTNLRITERKCCGYVWLCICNNSFYSGMSEMDAEITITTANVGIFSIILRFKIMLFQHAWCLNVLYFETAMWTQSKQTRIQPFINKVQDSVRSSVSSREVIEIWWWILHLENTGFEVKSLLLAWISRLFCQRF